MTHWTEEAFVENPDAFRVALEERAETGPEEVEKLLTMLDTDHDFEPETALDVACGVGRHAVPMGKAGFDVLGLDLSPKYLDVARKRAADAGVEDRVRFDEFDMRDLQSLDYEADLVTNLWTSFGYFDDETNRAVLAGMYSCVAEDGALVMDLANREGTLANFDADAVDENEGHLTAETREYDPYEARMATDLVIFEESGRDYETVGELHFDLRVYAPVELRRLLHEVGFSDVTFYANYDGDALERTSTHMVAVARP
ncbi:MAG: SAM-dependent methyltransferase [Natrialbaceae archaeon]|jgi:SAM-dependent methyltransferase